MTTVRSATTLPAAVLELATLRRPQYHDAFSVAGRDERTALQWADAVLTEAPADVRRRLVRAWSVLGLRVRTRAPGRVLGWEVRQESPHAVLLGLGSVAGMPAELVFARHDDAWWFGTVVRFDNPFVVPVWRAVEATHKHTVLGLLEDAERRLERDLDP